ncbi:MAG: MBL fold metallo-hydrolase [Methanomicrobiales archaeon]
MLVRHFFIPGIAHSSYLLGGDQICAIIDPARDIDRYLEAADEEGLAITHILETHLHADFVSGHMDLAEATGADIYAPAHGTCAFPHNPVAGGDTFRIETLEIEVRETPGHTPEHIVYVVTDTSRGGEPVGIFTGDTLFVNDVGRPDLFPGRARELATSLYSSLHDEIMELPDMCMVYPAHGAGSLCGKAIGAMRWSTIGYERRYNEPLQVTDTGTFITSLTVDMPPAPDHFGRCTEINRQGPALIRDLPSPDALRPGEFQRVAEEESTIVVDTRSYTAFGGMHIPGSYNLDSAGNVSTFAGWVLPPDRDMLLVCADPTEVPYTVTRLHRVGLDRVRGYLRGGMHAWNRGGYPAGHLPQLSAEEVNERVTGGQVTVLDVRTPDEYAGGHVPGAVNILAMDVRTRYAELDRHSPYILMCGSGIRASLAGSILLQHGFDHLYNAAGGMAAYRAAGFPIGGA